MNRIGSLANTAHDLVETRLQKGEPVRFHVFTTSMLPTLRPGDALLVQGTAATEAVAGSLVVVRTGNSWIVHRLIQHVTVGESLHLITKGDNRQFPDPGFESSLPIGVVTSIQRGDRTIHLFTWRARYGGRLLAWLSRGQVDLHQPAPGLLRKILLRVLHQGIYILALLVYKP